MLALRERLRPRGDEGFSLLETVIAITVAGVIFAGVGAATLSSVKAVLVGRTVQQASDVAEQAMESMRSLGYDAVSMNDSDLAVNEPLDLSGYKYDPIKNITTGSGVEDIVHGPAGTVTPHVAVVSPTTGSSYTVRKYVTQPVDTTAGEGTEYKRLTVVVSWTVRGDTRTRTLSSLIAAKRSGLPLPDYKFAASGDTQDCVSPGGQQVFGLSLTNNGARDSWSVSSSGGALAWSYYLDDGDTAGEYDAADSAVPTGASGPVVGPVETTTTTLFWAVANTNSATAIGTSTITFKVTSVAQPTYNQDVVVTLQVATTCASAPATPSPTATASSTPTPSATATAVPPTALTSCGPTTALPNPNPGGGTSSKYYYLQNAFPNDTNTTAAATLQMSKLSPPSSTSLWNYATDLSPSTPGRYAATAGSTVQTTVNWRYQFGQTTKLSGTGVLYLYAAPVSGSTTSSMGFTVTVERLSSAGAVQETYSANSYPAETWNCAGFKSFGVSINFGNKTIASNELISVKVKPVNTAALVAYDTTTYPSALVLPIKSGG